MRLLHEIAIFLTVKSKVIISLFETVRLSVSISLRNLYNSLNSIKEYVIIPMLLGGNYSRCLVKFSKSVLFIFSVFEISKYAVR